MALLIALLIVLGIIVLVVLFVIGIYNALVRLRNQVDNSWSQIDVQLKRRHDLIPNLVETAKGYMKHERETFETITNARSQAMQAGSVAEASKAEGALSGALSKFLLTVENYPDLKANENVMDLQNSLDEIETEIQLSRRYYNGAVRNNNVLVESFPSNLVANQFSFGKAEYFEIEDAADKAVPKVEL